MYNLKTPKWRINAGPEYAELFKGGGGPSVILRIEPNLNLTKRWSRQDYPDWIIYKGTVLRGSDYENP